MNPDEKGNNPNEWEGKRTYHEYMAWARGEEDEQRGLVTTSLEWTIQQNNSRLQEEVMRLVDCVVQEKERALAVQTELEAQRAITAQVMDTAVHSNAIAERLMTENQRLITTEAQLVSANIKLSHEVEALKLALKEIGANRVVDEGKCAENVNEKAVDSNARLISPPRKAIATRALTAENERLSSENEALKIDQEASREKLDTHKTRVAQAVAENERLSREIEMHKLDKEALGREFHSQVVVESREAQVFAESEMLMNEMEETPHVEKENRAAQVNYAKSQATQIQVASLSQEVGTLQRDKDALTRKLKAKVAYESRAAQAVAENNRLSKDIQAFTVENSFLRSRVSWHESIAASYTSETQRLLHENEALNRELGEVRWQVHAQVAHETGHSKMLRLSNKKSNPFYETKLASQSNTTAMLLQRDRSNVESRGIDSRTTSEEEDGHDAKRKKPNDI
jgi:hypothetical protein